MSGNDFRDQSGFVIKMSFEELAEEQSVPPERAPSAIQSVRLVINKFQHSCPQQQPQFQAVSLTLIFAGFKDQQQFFAMGETEIKGMAKATEIDRSIPGIGESIEVDFYRNPTILSRLILNQKYASAIKRLRLHPEEASVWVCSKRQTSKTSNLRPSALRSMLGRRSAQRRNNQAEVVEYSLRQLPIHVACSGLFRTSDAKLRAELEKLITHLVVAFPDGCGMVDHEGKLPLHEAIWHNGSPETISMLLMASPGTLHDRDKFGRSPIELNRFRSGSNKGEIKELLLLGVEFWKQARQEAKLRLKHAFVPPCSTSVGSVSVLAMNQSDMGSIGTGDSSNRMRGPIPMDPSFRKPVKIESEEIEPIAWSQLEKRALHLEQLLSEMYEKNYELGEVIEELTRSKMELHDELELLQGADLAEEVISLRRENAILSKDLAKSQHLIKEQGFEAKLAGSDSSRGSRSKSPRVGSSRGRSSMNAVRQEEVIEYLEDKNASTQQRVDELTELSREQQLKIERLEMVIGSLWKQTQGSDTDSTSRKALSWLHGTNEPYSAATDADASASVGGSSMAAEDSSYVSVKSSGAATAMSMPRDSDASIASREDYTNLLEKIQSNSRFATERYLAGKVRDLEEKLNAAIDTAEAEVTASREERNRLLKENEVLVAQVRALSSRSTATGASSMGGSDSLKTENLDELFQRAAAMYESDTSSGSSFTKNAAEKATKGTASPDLQELKRSKRDRRVKSTKDSYLPGGLAANAKDAEPLDDDDLDSLVKEAQEVYGKPLPSYLIAALEGASSRHSTSGSDQSSHAESSTGGSSSGSAHGSVEGLLMEAERLIGAPIPRDLVEAFQHVSSRKLSPLKQVAETSREDSSEGERREDEGDVDSIISKAEAMLGAAISEEMASALRAVWPDSDNSHSGTSDSPAGLFEDSTGSRTDSFGASSGKSKVKREVTSTYPVAEGTEEAEAEAEVEGTTQSGKQTPPPLYEI